VKVPASVIVTGGGVVGLCTAVALQEAGLSARLIDPMTGGEASWGNAGCLAADECAPLASPETAASIRQRLFGAGGPLDFVWQDLPDWLPWGLRFLAASTPERFAHGVKALSALNKQAIAAWRRLLGEADFARLMRVEGHFILYEGKGAQARGLAALADAPKGDVAFRPLSDPERAFLSNLLTLGDFGGARLYGTGQVRSQAMVFEALYARLIRAGGVISRGRVAAIVRTSTGCAAVLEEGARWEAEAMVIAAGARSGALLGAAGLKAPLIAERGYHIGFESEDWPDDFPPILFHDRSTILTRLETGLRATSFVEFGRPDSAPDARKWDRLEAHMRTVGVLKGGAVTRWMGARPTLPDYLPAIGGGERQGLFYAVGHAHLGFTQAAITAEIVRALVLQNTPIVDVGPFALRRFQKKGAWQPPAAPPKSGRTASQPTAA
jgi:D-amino-acid dehydrogenase